MNHFDDYPMATTWTGIVVGLITWISATASLGPLGFFFGWLPAIVFGYIAALIAPVLWVLLVAAIVGVCWLLARQS